MGRAQRIPEWPGFGGRLELPKPRWNQHAMVHGPLATERAPVQTSHASPGHMDMLAHLRAVVLPIKSRVLAHTHLACRPAPAAHWWTGYAPDALRSGCCALFGHTTTYVRWEGSSAT